MRFAKALGFLFWAAIGGCVCAGSWLTLRWISPRRHFRFLGIAPHWVARRAARVIGLRVRVSLQEGCVPPETMLLAANHRGYLDVLALYLAFPLRFVAKSDMRGWPVFGQLAVLFGTVFCERDSARKGREAMAEARKALSRGGALAVFPEGTSSPGPAILPFSALFFESAVQAGVPVLPVHLEYTRVDGKPADAALRERVCWYGDQSFFPHFWSLLGLRSIEAEIRMGLPLPPGLDRKTLRRGAYAAVVGLSQAWTAYGKSTRVRRKGRSRTLAASQV